MARRPTLSTSSYAVLGQVAVTGPLSAYELAQTMRRNVHFFWPRAASHVYAEAKALEAAGLLANERVFVGKRPRTEYRITAAGKRALAAYLRTPLSREPSLEIEALLRVFLATAGRPEDLVRALDQLADQTDTFLAMLARNARDYARGESAFQREVRSRALVYDFFVPYAALLREWAERSRRTAARWDTGAVEAKKAVARKRFAALSEDAERARRPRAKLSGRAATAR
jgi:PadR family transcriptional regulator, regulatory protein AphA